MKEKRSTKLKEHGKKAFYINMQIHNSMFIGAKHASHKVRFFFHQFAPLQIKIVKDEFFSHTDFPMINQLLSRLLSRVILSRAAMIGKGRI